MQKKCFPFDIKKSSHQLSKHRPGRRAGMLLQSSGEHKAGAFLQNCVKRNLRLWPQLRGRGGNTARMPDRQLLRPRGPRRVEGLLNGGVFSTDSRGVAPSSQTGCRLRSGTESWKVLLSDMGPISERRRQRDTFTAQGFGACQTEGGGDRATGTGQTHAPPPDLYGERWLSAHLRFNTDNLPWPETKLRPSAAQH